jgi:protein HOOK3
MDSYKTQVAELEQRAAARAAELEGARFEAAQAKDTLRAVEAERARDADTLELYQERVRELELSVGRTPARKPAARAAVDSESDAIAESGSRDTVSDATSEREPGSAIDAPEEELDEGFAGGLGGELDDALSGTTMTELKLQLGRLQRELAAARTNSAEASRVLVLENLLDDARRMKSRYEADYLAAHREKLKLQSDLEEIRSGKALGDGLVFRRPMYSPRVERISEPRRRSRCDSVSTRLSTNSMRYGNNTPSSRSSSKVKLKS